MSGFHFFLGWCPALESSFSLYARHHHVFLCTKLKYVQHLNSAAMCGIGFLIPLFFHYIVTRPSSSGCFTIAFLSLLFWLLFFRVRSSVSYDFLDRLKGSLAVTLVRPVLRCRTSFRPSLFPKLEIFGTFHPSVSLTTCKPF